MDRQQQREALGAELGRAVRGQVRIDAMALALYSTDASIYQIEPLAVVLPVDSDDVAAAVAYAARNKLSIVPRGGGSGLAGEAVGPGIVIDMSRFMNRIGRVDAEANEVVVGPGVILAELNQQLAAVGKQFGPDPASGNRATIGGMTGNNATGAHSLKFGYTGAHIRSAKIVAADGELLEVGRYANAAGQVGRVGKWAEQIDGLIKEHRDALIKARPEPERNGSGYNLYPFIDHDDFPLVELLAGSEGTLAVVTEATLGLVDLPPVKMLLQVNFDSLSKMGQAVPEILKLDPSACELMDGKLLKMARDAYPRYHDVLPDKIAASLLVEFDGATESEVNQKLTKARQFVEQFASNMKPVFIKEVTSPAVQARIWAARKAAVPLLFRTDGETQPIPVIEDIAVPPARLDEYLCKLDEITKRMGVPMAYYAHAGHGELHTRPYLNLRLKEDVQKMKDLAEEVFEMVWQLGGTISGEHGEGIVRASFIKRQYGEEVYNLFKSVKGVFDPDNVMNPGKIINEDPEAMTSNLRLQNRPVMNYKTNLIFRPGEFVNEMEKCSGDGLCRSKDVLLSMCPIFRALGDEESSPRGKINLMRNWLIGKLDPEILGTDEFKAVADLCVNCKMCVRECPSLVNTPKLMMEARVEYVRRHGLTRPQFALVNSEWMSRLSSTFGPLANFFLQTGWFRAIMQTVLGLDKRRPMPPFEMGSNLHKLRKHIASLPELAAPQAKVAYFVDLYANFNDHQLGRAVVDILHHNNIEVTVPPQMGVSMPAITYGAIKTAKKAIAYNVDYLARAVKEGYTVVCSEPTAALALQEEYLDLVDDEQARLVAENTVELTDFLSSLHKDGKLKTDFRAQKMTLAYHVPCHYKALNIEGGTLELLSLIPGLEIERLPNSCCGIAGTFGFQKKNFDLSMKAGEPMLAVYSQSKADYGLTECGTCKMQMELAGDKKVLHPAKILAHAYGLGQYII